MATRLMIQRPGEPAAAVEIGSGLTLGGSGDGLRVQGLAGSALALWPSREGIVVEARAAGILVSGSPLSPGQRRLLRQGDRARVGELEIWPEPSRALDEARVGTRALAGAILAGEEVLALPGPRLLVVEGPAAGERLALHDGAVLGRGREAPLQLGDPLASRRHARFTVRAGRISVEDLSSKNGIAVNGRRPRRSRIALRSGDALALGGSVLVFEEGAEEGAEDGAATGAPVPEPPSGLAAPAGPAGAPPDQARLARGRRARAALLASCALIALALLLALAAVL